MRTLSLLLAAGAWLATEGTAAAFDHKCPPAGTEVRTSLIPRGAPIRYEGQRGLWCLRSRDGKPINSELGHFRFYPRNPETSDVYGKYVSAAAELWPLYPGKETSFPFNAVGDGSSAGALRSNNDYLAEISVEAQRQITVQGGTFSVLPIVIMHRGTHGNYHVSSETYYYSPELGTNVKYEYQLISGSSADQPKSWELVEFSAPVAGGGATR